MLFQTPTSVSPTQTLFMPSTAPKPPAGYPLRVGSLNTLPVGLGSWQNASAATANTCGSDTACADGTLGLAGIFVNRPVRCTGIQYLVGSVGGTDKVIVVLYDSVGAVLANSATAGTTVGTAAQVQQVAFTAVYNIATPGLYYLGLVFNGTTAKFRTVPAYCQAGTGLIAGSVAQTFGTVAAAIMPTTFTADKAGVCSLY
jgi:hypothetical protein